MGDRGRVYQSQPVTPFTAADTALREGRMFIATTGIIPVDVDNSLYATIRNPADSGVDMHILERWFDSNRASGSVPLEYTAYANPTITLAETANPINLNFGDGAGVAVFRYEMGESLAMGGVTGSAAPIPTGGVRAVLSLPLILHPGSTLGFRIDGGGANINQAARIGISFIFFEEGIA
jgi:hypothetical protein